MRFKVKLPDQKTYQEVSHLLREQKEMIFTVSEKRNILSTGSLSVKLVDYIKSRGGKISSEQQYEPDNNAFSKITRIFNY